MTVVTNNTIQPSSGQALTIKDEGGTASITVATNGEATFAENIILTANKGINFSAYGSEDSSSATTVSNNLLDDYEEGTWAPTLKDHLGNQGTLSSSSGYYCKVGNQVTLWMNINLSSKSSMTGNVRISSLPFSIKDILSTTGNDGIGVFGQYGDLVTSVSWLGLRANQTDNELEVSYSSSTGSTTIANLGSSNIGNNFNFRAMFTYVAT